MAEGEALCVFQHTGAITFQIGVKYTFIYFPEKDSPIRPYSGLYCHLPASLSLGHQETALGKVSKNLKQTYPRLDT